MKEKFLKVSSNPFHEQVIDLRQAKLQLSHKTPISSSLWIKQLLKELFLVVKTSMME